LDGGLSARAGAILSVFPTASTLTGALTKRNVPAKCAGGQSEQQKG
jgi:hypothetical protein